MGITVRAALQLGHMREATVIGGNKGLDRIIRFVDISETPDSCAWVRPNEFLITTCYSIKDDPKAQLKLLRALAEVGGAGLAIKFGRFIGDVSMEMRLLADELEMPLISLPNNVPFIDFTHPLMTAILNEQAALLIYSEKIHRTLTDIALETNSLDALANGLSSITQHKFAIYSHDLTPSILSSLREETIFPVKVKDRIYGYIALESNAILTPKDKIAIRHAQTLAALQMINKELARESNRNYDRDFLEDLLAGRVQNQDLLLARAKEVGFSMTGNKYLCIVDIDDFSGYLLSRKISEKQASDIKRRLFYIVQDALSNVHKQIFSVQKSDCIITILPAELEPKTKQQKKQTFHRLFERIHRNVAKQLKHVSVSIALSDQITSPAAFREKYEQLCKIVTLSRKINGPGHHVFWEDTAVYLLLHNMGTSLVPFYQAMLGALSSTQIKNGEELIHTLQTYLDCQGNSAETASKLFIHRNTLRYRLQRIEQLIERKLDSAETRFMLWLALKARDLH